MSDFSSATIILPDKSDQFCIVTKVIGDALMHLDTPSQGCANKYGRQGAAIPVYIRIFKKFRSSFLMGKLSGKSCYYFVILLAACDS